MLKGFIKWIYKRKYTYDDKKCEACGIKYKDCDCFFKYTNFIGSFKRLQWIMLCQSCYISCFICPGKKPDLTYYHNSSLPLKNFLYTTQRKTLAHFPTPSVKMKTFTLKKISYVSGWMWTKHKIFDTLLYSGTTAH